MSFEHILVLLAIFQVVYTMVLRNMPEHPLWDGYKKREGVHKYGFWLAIAVIITHVPSLLV